MPGDFGGPVCSCAFSLVGLHTRPRVHRAPGIPARPLFSGGAQINGKPRAVLAARMRTCVSTLFPCLNVIASAAKQSILSYCRAMDCFAEPVIGRRFAPTRWLAMTLLH